MRPGFGEASCFSEVRHLHKVLITSKVSARYNLNRHSEHDGMSSSHSQYCYQLKSTYQIVVKIIILFCNVHSMVALE